MDHDCQGIHNYSARYLSNDTTTEVLEEKNVTACENQITKVIIISDDDDLLVKRRMVSKTVVNQLPHIVAPTIEAFTDDLSDTEPYCLQLMICVDHERLGICPLISFAGGHVEL